MKRLVNSMLAVIITALVMFGVKFYIEYDPATSSDQDIYIYNWGEYIDPDLIDKFESETGYNVIYETFDSNEAMYTKVAAGSSPYDIVFPSDYMVQKMAEANMLDPLDYSMLDGMERMDSRFLNQPFDPGNVYSIPYFWGTVGIVYNTTMTDLTFESWTDLWDPSLENNVLLVDGAREVLGMSLQTLGYSLNSTDPRELSLAQDNLYSLRDNVRAIIGDEVLQLMPQGEAAAAITWAGSAALMLDENEDLDYVVPSEGSNIFLDNMVIPNTSENKEGAYAFINFMLEPENAAQNTEWVGYSTPNLEAMEYLDPEITSDTRFYPGSDVTDRCEYYEYLGVTGTQLYNDMFLEFKMF